MRSHIEKSSSGACGAQACHAATTVAASLHGQVARYVTTFDAGRVENLKPVTIPNCPAPPPRHAQKRSGCCVLLARSAWPVAVTITSDTRLSHASPHALPEKPCPPPSVRPAIPTVGQEPAGIAAPWRLSA